MYLLAISAAQDCGVFVEGRPGSHCLCLIESERWISEGGSAQSA